METKANYVAVGAFVLACMLGLVVTLLWLAGVQYSQEYVYYTTHFKGSVSGLGKGTVVRYNGLEVGRIDNLDFDPNDPKQVVATLQVRPDLKIHNDAVASIASQGLTGGSYIEIIGGSEKAPVFPQTAHQPYPDIRSKPSAFAQLEEQLPALGDKLNKVADKLNNVLNDKNQKSIAETLQNLAAITTDVRGHLGDLNAILRNTNTTTANLAVASRDLHPVLLQANATLQKLSKLSTDADNVVTGEGMAQLGALIAESRTLVGS